MSGMELKPVDLEKVAELMAKMEALPEPSRTKIMEALHFLRLSMNPQDPDRLTLACTGIEHLKEAAPELDVAKRASQLLRELIAEHLKVEVT